MGEWSDERRLDMRRIHLSLNIPSIVDKIRKNKLRWFGRITGREESEVIRVVMQINV